MTALHVSIRAMLFVLFMLVPVATAQSQTSEGWTPGHFLAQAVARVYGLVSSTVISDRGIGFADGISMLGTLVKPGETTTLVRSLTAGTTYLLVAGGDDDAEDLDVEVKDMSGRTLASDVESDAIPVVEFTPLRSGRYQIVLSLPRSAVDAFLVLAILREGGWTMPLDRMVLATGKLIRAGSLLAERSPSYFLHERNQWAVWGGVVDADDSLELTTITMGSGQRVVVAASDSPTGDIDVLVSRTSGSVVERDESQNVDAAVILETSAGRTYDVKSKNAGRTPHFVMTGVLQVGKRGTGVEP
jgi:hypothetical protein